MNDREVKPWDMINPMAQHASDEVREARYDVCKGCEHFIKLTRQCSICHCFMAAKTLLLHATCPENKWAE